MLDFVLSKFFARYSPDGTSILMAQARTQSADFFIRIYIMYLLHLGTFLLCDILS